MCIYIYIHMYTIYNVYYIYIYIYAQFNKQATSIGLLQRCIRSSTRHASKHLNPKCRRTYEKPQTQRTPLRAHLCGALKPHYVTSYYMTVHCIMPYRIIAYHVIMTYISVAISSLVIVVLQQFNHMIVCSAR